MGEYFDLRCKISKPKMLDHDNCYISRYYFRVMNKIIIIGIIIVGVTAAAFLSPYFTESTVIEELPENMSDGELSAVSYSGTFVGVGDGIHDAQGDAYTIPLKDGNTVLRLENFRSTNGPDLYVYLSADIDAKDFVNLGSLKANQGDQNYDIPDGVDLDKYNKVLVWCKPFGVLFGSAEITPTM